MKKPSWGVRFIGVLGEILLTLGVIFLLFVAWELWYTNVDAQKKSDEVTQSVQQQFSAKDSQTVTQKDSGSYGKAPVTALHLQGQTFGIMYVPRFGADWTRPITNGVGKNVLNNLGVGHYPSTAMPGELGNFAVAAHRQTHGQAFWDMDKLQAGDRVFVETEQGYYTYKWVRTDVVLPTQNEVLDPVPYKNGEKPTQSMLTMTTCHPPYSTEKRMVAFATLESWRPLEAGPPPEIAQTVANTMRRG